MRNWQQKQFITIKTASRNSTIASSAALLVTYLLFYSSNIQNLTLWFFCALLYNSTPYMLSYWHHRRYKNLSTEEARANFSFKNAVNHYSILKWSTSLIWLFPAFVIMPQVALDQQTMIVIILACLGSGSMTTQLFSRNLSIATLASYSLPMALLPLLTNNSFGYSFSVLSLIYMGVLSAQIVMISGSFRSEWELLQKNEELVRANEHKAKNMIRQERATILGQVTGGVAHEINNPLSIIVGYAENIQNMIDNKNSDAERIHRDASKILSASARASGIIKSLRKISRDGSKDPFEPIEIESLLVENLGYLKAELNRHAIEVRTSETPREASILGQPGEISQVLLHLLSNSIDAIKSQEEKWIELSVEVEENWVRLAVTDSGQGIASDLQDKIMLPFFSTKEVGKGAGLGLSFSNSIAELHGGRLNLDRDHPHTRFVVTLPRHHHFKLTEPSPSVA